ncbi:MAG: N-6 DNA methylase [Cyclobacteriaceae bacterium]|nr:MAG: N-6 DNA methylase [Cyclobacteriaceae bacterium]
MTKEEAKQKISDLVVRFGEQIESYKKSDYNETLTRRDFIDPFFKALGWDIDNEQGYAEAYREVIHEDRVKVGSATKAPDYSFRLVGGKRLFFVEAKKPSVVVKDDILPAYQIRRYGWSAKLPISIITDFEEFAIYDCTKKPNPSDKASVARIKYLTFKDYIKEFDFLWDTFSKEKVLKGSFDKFIQSDTGKKGTATVDKEFLSSLDNWRTYLAQSISSNNKEIDEDELNFIVQQTIDRIIFLRIAEDRAVENYGNLKTTLKGDCYQNLFLLFKEADQKYNSGLFDFKKDKLSENIKVDNKVIKNIINDLYYPESPYEFSVLSVEILGSAYEQFLGKVIRLTPAHHAKIEEKPEVRKAGGVYYTPQYIVEYIVESTLGKLIDGKTPKEISKIKIADPACGSGSFLIGAYQYLLDYHKNYYSENGKPSKGKKDSPLTPEGNLTTSEKKRILLNNIYGVDLDFNAVEVTKLSLLLKCMEGETSASIANQMKLFNERVLPTLDDNIKSGNSLIDLDFYDGQLDFGGERKIKPFNWKKGFPEVFKNGGFDLIIGNPPYVLVSPELFSDEVIEYFKRFKVSEYKIDLYHLFIERGLGLLKPNGSLGFIVPSTWMTQKFTDRLRKFVLEQSSIDEVLHFDYKVFDQADVFTEIIILNNSKPSIDHKIKFIREEGSVTSGKVIASNVMSETQKSFLKIESYAIDIRSLTREGKIVAKIIKSFPALEQIARASLGAQAYNSSKHSKSEIENRVFHSDKKLSKEYLPELAGNDVGRYTLERKKGQWIKYGSWLHDYRSMDWLTGPRILIREITGKDPYKIQGTYTEDTYCNYKTILNVNPSDKTNFSMKYLCGLLNSKLLSFIFKNSSNKIEANSFPRLSVGDIKKLPIKDIDFKNKDEKTKHDEIIKLVDEIMKLNMDLKSINLADKIEQVQNRIDYLNNRIDKIVYELYDLKQSDIAIIEKE